MTYSPKIMHLWKTIFKKLIIVVVILCSYSHAATAQMSGTYTIAPSGGHYTSIADAVTALGPAGMSGVVVL